MVSHREVAMGRARKGRQASRMASSPYTFPSSLGGTRRAIIDLGDTESLSCVSALA